MRNPATVEARIWDLLNAKLAKIMVALGGVMDEPEDLLQLVLGMSSPGIFTELFAEAHHVKGQKLGEWFDRKAATFGGRPVIDAVKSLVGHASRFDLTGLKEVPNVDLPHLRQFFENVLTLNRRRPVRTEQGLSFKTPDGLLDEPGIRRKYEDVVFARAVPSGRSAEKVIGVGHKVFDKALRTASEYPVSLAWSKEIEYPLLVFQVYDRITDQSGRMRQAVVGVECDDPMGDNGWATLRDWQVLERLNAIKPRENVQDDPAVEAETLRGLVDKAGSLVAADIASFRFPFKIPEWKPIGVVWAVR